MRSNGLRINLNIMKTLIFLLLAFSINICFAQNTQMIIKPVVKGASVVLGVQTPNVYIEGYDGEDITIEMVPLTTDRIPVEATGLKPVKIPDPDRQREKNILNTKIRQYKEQAYMSIGIPLCNCERINIKVPKDPVVSVVSTYYGREGVLSIKNINNEVQVQGWMPTIELDNIRGFLIVTGGAEPGGRRASDKITLKNIHWSDELLISGSLKRKREYSVSANSASIDISIPDTLKGTILYKSRSGQVFSDLGVASTPASAEYMKRFDDPFHKEPGFKTIPLNGGGKANLEVNTGTGNIYIRKQK